MLLEMAVGPELMAHDYNVDSALWPGEGVVPTLNPVGKPARFRSSAEEGWWCEGGRGGPVATGWSGK